MRNLFKWVHVDQKLEFNLVSVKPVKKVQGYVCYKLGLEKNIFIKSAHSFAIYPILGVWDTLNNAY